MCARMAALEYEFNTRVFSWSTYSWLPLRTGSWKVRSDKAAASSAVNSEQIFCMWRQWSSVCDGSDLQYVTAIIIMPHAQARYTYCTVVLLPSAFHQFALARLNPISMTLNLIRLRCKTCRKAWESWKAAGLWWSTLWRQTQCKESCETVCYAK